ncbi:unnamed protein product, partial [Leptidea sinapis]
VYFIITVSVVVLFSGGLTGLDGLEDDDQSPSTHSENKIHDDPISIDKNMVQHPRYKCHQCESPECEDGEDAVLRTCGSALSCFKSTLWLITHFHPLGSLYEHLSRNTLTRQQMMLACLSIVNGLLHLHTDIHGTQGKPAIAHRDIKSKNILVKADGECCIADLGLASYRKCDVYALGLVLWEVAVRVSPARPHAPPYGLLAPADPPFDLMRKIVCTEQARPTPPDHPHPTMVGICKLMQECWHQNPSVRLPALRIKKTLLKLAAADPSIHLDIDNEVSL